MPEFGSNDIAISAPYFQIGESVANARYRWSCHDRGDEPFVILQWTLSGEGVYENGSGPVPVPPEHAFLAVVPEDSSYYFPPNSDVPWVFTWINFYGPLACDLARRFKKEFGSVIPLASRGAAAAAFRRLLALTAQSQLPDRAR